MSKTGIKLENSEGGGVAYLFLPEHPGKGMPAITAKQISLHSVIDNYKGPGIFLDFDKDGRVIGVEVFLD